MVLSEEPQRHKHTEGIWLIQGGSTGRRGNAGLIQWRGRSPVALLTALPSHVFLRSLILRARKLLQNRSQAERFISDSDSSGGRRGKQSRFSSDPAPPLPSSLSQNPFIPASHSSSGIGRGEPKPRLSHQEETINWTEQVRRLPEEALSTYL